MAGSGPSLVQRQTRMRDALIVVLAVLTGVTDAVAFLRLDGVFTSVMTGNMVLMGIAIGEGRIHALWRSGGAVLGYIVGAMLGGVISDKAGGRRSVWPTRVTAALVAELALFVVVNALWFGSGTHIGSLGRGCIVGLEAVALGVQSSAVIGLNVAGMSTTYLTGTLTQVARGLIVDRTLRGNGRSALTLVALVGGGAFGAWWSKESTACALLPPVVILVAVLLLVWRSALRHDAEA